MRNILFGLVLAVVLLVPRPPASRIDEIMARLRREWATQAAQPVQSYPGPETAAPSTTELPSDPPSEPPTATPLPPTEVRETPDLTAVVPATATPTATASLVGTDQEAGPPSPTPLPPTDYPPLPTRPPEDYSGTR